MIVEFIILTAFVFYFILGYSQLDCALEMKGRARLRRFPKKNLSVSVIIPIRGVTETTIHNLESVCKQDYPHYEVMFVAQSESHLAYAVAQGLSRRYPHARVLVSGPHDFSRTIGKSHSLTYGADRAKGEVLLFGDSDVSYSRNWIAKMTSPISETVLGRKIHVTTAPFFIEPKGFLGKFAALSISLVTFTASFTRREQNLPPYASGASIAIPKELFYRLNIPGIWRNSFNDDLVLANAVIDSGRNIYSRMDLPNHPNEAFSGAKGSLDKLIRWVVTISTFSHGKLKAEVPRMVVMNLQFQVALISGLILYFTGFFAMFALGIVILGYTYCVTYRWAIGKIIEEKGMTPYYILAPVSITIMMIFYVIVRLSYRSFSWEGERYSLG